MFKPAIDCVMSDGDGGYAAVSGIYVDSAADMSPYLRRYASYSVAEEPIDCFIHPAF
jgi:hypothetical protein